MIITIPGHFACSSFAMHRRLTFAPPVRTASRFWSSPRRARVFGCVRHPTKASCAGASLRVAVSYLAWFLRSPRAVDLLTVDALCARSAVDRETAIRKRIARMVVDDGHERARTGGAAKVAVCI